MLNRKTFKTRVKFDLWSVSLISRNAATKNRGNRREHVRIIRKVTSLSRGLLYDIDYASYSLEHDHEKYVALAPRPRMGYFVKRISSHRKKVQREIYTRPDVTCGYAHIYRHARDV